MPSMAELGGASLAGPGPSRLRRPEPPTGSRPVRVTVPRASALRAVRPRSQLRSRPTRRLAAWPRHAACPSGRPASPSNRNSPARCRRHRSAASPCIASAAVIDTFGRPSCAPACHACSPGQPLRVLRALRPRWREVTGLRARAACPGTDALPRRQLSLNRRPPWTSIPSSPSGAGNRRRASFRTRSSGRSRHDACSRDAKDQPRSSPMGNTPRVASPAGFVERNPANAAGSRWSQKAAADDAPTASDCRATSSASGAAKTATPSARRSARTPSTQPPVKRHRKLTRWRHRKLTPLGAVSLMGCMWADIGAWHEAGGVVHALSMVPIPFDPRGAVGKGWATPRRPGPVERPVTPKPSQAGPRRGR